MARIHAVDSRWLRTREQIDGCAYPGPLMQVRSRHDVEALLVEYDVARTNSIDEAELLIRTTALRENIRLISPSTYDGLIIQLARMHNYTYLLDKFPNLADPEIVTTGTGPTASESTIANSTQAPTDTRSTQPSIGTTKTSAEPTASSKSAGIISASTSTEACPQKNSTDASGSSTHAHVVSVPSSASVENTTPVPSEVLTGKELAEVVRQYKRDQRSEPSA
jgi:hypothetical protein